MKRVLSIVISILILTAVFPMTANADEGPKPSVVVDFRGLDDGTTYYAALLSKTSSTGPNSVLVVNSREYAEYKELAESNEYYNILMKFVDYEDSDGFYFL